jgi:hypothetical protein
MWIEPKDWKVSIETKINKQMGHAPSHFMGKEVRLKRGRYAGRLGRVDGVSLTQDSGGWRLCFLVSIPKLQNGGFLNNHRHARSYWKFNDLEWNLN